MTIWANSEIDWYYAAGESETGRCNVRIDGPNVVLDFIYEGTRYIFRGTEDGEGHFRLHDDAGSKSRYHLHRFRDDEVLDGVWFAGSEMGMCRITLASDD